MLSLCAAQFATWVSILTVSFKRKCTSVRSRALAIAISGGCFSSVISSVSQLVTSLILSRLDCCNSVLVNLLSSTIAPLQHVQNIAARLVLNLDCRCSITAVLVQIPLAYWVTVHYRILLMLKGATLMCDVFQHCCPACLHNLVMFTESDSARSRLRSSTTRSAVTVRTRTKLGERAFPSLDLPCGTVHRLNFDSLTVDVHVADGLSAVCFTSF